MPEAVLYTYMCMNTAVHVRTSVLLISWTCKSIYMYMYMHVVCSNVRSGQKLLAIHLQYMQQVACVCGKQQV